METNEAKEQQANSPNTPHITPLSNEISHTQGPISDSDVTPSADQPMRLPLTLEITNTDTQNKSKNSDLELQLFEACRRGEMTKIQKLVGQQVDINAKDLNGRKSTALHFAAGFGRRDAVECLLSHGARVNTQDDGGLIPLHNACSFGHVEVVTCLLEQGADANSRDKWGYTPLHEASNKGKVCNYFIHISRICSF